MNQLYRQPADFEAIIRIYSFEEGGRKSPTFNGIRWDFSYADWPDEKLLEIFMIWPDFFDEKGNSIQKYHPLPTGIDLPARMLIINDQMRDFHRQRIQEGTLFYCHEGAKRLASGRVTRVTGLISIGPFSS